MASVKVGAWRRGMTYKKKRGRRCVCVEGIAVCYITAHNAEYLASKVARLKNAPSHLDEQQSERKGHGFPSGWRN